MFTNKLLYLSNVAALHIFLQMGNELIFTVGSTTCMGQEWWQKSPQWYCRSIYKILRSVKS